MIGLRIAFSITLAIVGLFNPVAVGAQQSAKVYRVALLDDSAPEAARAAPARLPRLVRPGRLPRRQVFDPEQLETMMGRMERGETL